MIKEQYKAAQPASSQLVMASRGWHASIRAGNAHYRAGRYQPALRWYREAARLVDQQIADTAMNVPLLLAKVITLQNAAAACARLSDTVTADQTYREVHGLVRDIALDRHQPPGLRATALRQCRLTLWEWNALRGTKTIGEDVTWH